VNLKWKILLIFDVLVIILSAYVIVSEIWPYLEIARYNQDVGVINNAALHNPIDLGIEFDFCGEVTEDSDPVAQLKAGTPVPFESVAISNEVVPMTPSYVQLEPTSVPNLPVTLTPDPSPTPTISAPAQGLGDEPLKVVRAENYEDDNYHLVFVAAGYGDNGYGDAYIFGEMPELIWNISNNFSGINIDFAYVDSSVDADFKHVQQAVEFENEADQNKLFDKIKKEYPVDGVVVLVNTPLFLGTKSDNFAILSGSDPNTKRIATHEVAHMLSLDDGYQFIYGKSYLPGSELFYADRMPSKLVKALEKMDVWPTMYKVGYCQGEAVYSFYESNNNQMRDYLPSETKSWGESTFTPLQTIMMNDYVAWLKGQN
jgi:hypothetical protein